ncbi:Na+/melibiose symporter-like transporter [Anaerobacterium chartisolvens]|uniref:Na+/melibiose symporter-like transporter n=1 Tax=Anaerobacterium chartisolvens TaxID=1297424 RepID=A0A369ATF1_9FIRM|nr:MFS transporter [Anaerobacterium chartisolvens]RCX12501.1 Na+/melibiose symporter-like transporter [Anaerobacterium chartisolvens]
MMNFEQFKLLKNWNFFLFWLGCSISTLGSGLSGFVFMIFVYSKTGSALQSGMVALITALTNLLTGPFIGHMVDNYNKKHLIIIANLIQAVTTLLVMVSPYLFLIYILVFVNTVLGKVFSVCKMSIVPKIVDKPDMISANSLFLFVSKTLTIVSPALAGILIAIYGNYIAFILDSISFVICAALSYFVNYGPKEIELIKKGNESEFFRQVLDNLKIGVGTIMEDNTTRYYAIVGIADRILNRMVGPLMMVYIISFLGRDTKEFGFFCAIGTLGNLVGSLLAGVKINAIRNIDNRKLFSICIVLFALLNPIIYMVNTYLIALIITFTSGLIFYIAVANIHSDIQIKTPEERRGAVFSNIGSIFGPFTSLSIFFGTFLADIFGVQKVLLVSSTLFLVVITFLIAIQNAKLFNRRQKINEGI